MDSRRASMVAAILVACAAVLATTNWWRQDGNFDVEKVVERALACTSRSWEFGTLSQALLELRNPELTVFGTQPFPNGYLPEVSEPDNVDGLRYAQAVIRVNHSDLLIDGEGSPSDPASLGTAALLLSSHNVAYFEAAKRQAEYLVDRATRFHISDSASAISHRDEPPELWGDFVYMVPPFLAYYGVKTQDLHFLKEAVRQCQLYNEVLRTNVTLETGQTCHGLWRHIVADPAVLPDGKCCMDPDVWLTSNAWAVAGITRVLATLSKWRPPPGSRISAAEYARFRDEGTKSLLEILTSLLECTLSQARDSESGLLKNYLDGPSHPTVAYAFGDTAGTALMAAVVYRLACLFSDTFATPKFLGWADRNRRAVSKHVDGTGIAGPVADVSHVPSKVPVPQTSEGQSMVLLMHSARRDYLTAGLCSNKGPLWRSLSIAFASWWQG
ncbi:family 88 glycosyl hydrolase [Exophiala viscosa]|uniref:Family 88 glycosyl hydrolase n=1 Tax=Exophiala viscosa TaxID=2486360 RepID=A0AAN6E1V0_9EURO|nr:family 88 glycosyl hydrolase [Exophiala viscosa]